MYPILGHGWQINGQPLTEADVERSIEMDRCTAARSPLPVGHHCRGTPFRRRLIASWQTS